MIKKKRAGLNLSINAIVVLILAITMLGLGLSFMRNIFTSATEEFQEIGGTVKKQMIDQMKESNKVVDISRPKVDLKAGESTQVFVGFRNDGNNPKYFLIDTTNSKATRLGGNDNCNLESNGVSKEVYLEFKKAETEVLKGDVVVLPINIKTTSDVFPDTCFYEMEVIYGENKEDLESGNPDGSITMELTVDVIT